MWLLQIVKNPKINPDGIYCVGKMHKKRQKISLFIFGSNFLKCCNLVTVGV